MGGGGGLPPGTFGLIVLSGRGMGSDLWQSGFADSQFKSRGPGPARTARDFACLSVARVPGWLDLGLVQFYVVGWGKYARFFKI